MDLLGLVVDLFDQLAQGVELAFYSAQIGVDQVSAKTGVVVDKAGNEILGVAFDGDCFHKTTAVVGVAGGHLFRRAHGIQGLLQVAGGQEGAFFDLGFLHRAGCVQNLLFHPHFDAAVFH